MRSCGTWTVRFNLTAAPAGGGFLTIGLAGASRNPHLNVAVNGVEVINQTFGNDGALYRSGLTGGVFQMLTANVPAASLKAGANSVTFELTNARVLGKSRVRARPMSVSCAQGNRL